MASVGHIAYGPEDFIVTISGRVLEKGSGKSNRVGKQVRIGSRLSRTKAIEGVRSWLNVE